MSLLCGVCLIPAREDLNGLEIQFCMPSGWPNAHNSIKTAQLLRHTNSFLCHRELVYSTVSLDPVYSPLRDSFQRDGVNCQQGTTEGAHCWCRHKGPSTIPAEIPCKIKLWEKRVKTTQKKNSWIYGHIIFCTCASVCKCAHGQTQ